MPMCINLDEILELDKQIKTLPASKIALYGAGSVCIDMVKYYKALDVELVAIIDSNPEKIGRDIDGVKIISKEDLRKYKATDISIQASVGESIYDEVRDSILEIYPEYSIYEYGKNSVYSINRQRYVSLIINRKDEIMDLVNNFADDESRHKFEMVLRGFVTEDMKFFEEIATMDQYFNDLTILSDHEVFIDAGAYDGDTLEEFYRKTDGKFSRAICFEPFNEKYVELKKKAKELSISEPIIETFELALYSERKELFLDTSEFGGASSKVGQEDTGYKIRTTTLDEMEIEDVSFIKMDIEGSELNALKGAEKTILRYKPKLAICTYHNPEDVIEIYNWINNLDLSYKIYLRHHCMTAPNQYCETVLYAIA